LSNDTQLLASLDLTGAEDETVAEHILQRSQWDDLAVGEKRLNLFFRPSRRIRNDLCLEETLQVDCHVPAKQDYVAYEILARVVYLLKNYEVNGRIFYFEGQLGELPTMPGFFCAGARFNYFIVK